MSENRAKKKIPYSIQYKEAFKKWKSINPDVKVTPIGVLVMKILIEYVNNKSKLSYPTVKLIMAETELSKSAVFKALKRLEDLMLIKRFKVRYSGQVSNHNVYKILLNDYIEQTENTDFETDERNFNGDRYWRRRSESNR
jgi:predicted transcriptional regulator